LSIADLFLPHTWECTGLSLNCEENPTLVWVKAKCPTSIETQRLRPNILDESAVYVDDSQIKEFAYYHY